MNKPPLPKTPATADDLRAMTAIAPGRVTYIPASFDKRFARDIGGHTALTEGQRMLLWRMVWRYRRQIVERDLVQMAKSKITPLLKAGVRI